MKSQKMERMGHGRGLAVAGALALAMCFAATTANATTLTATVGGVPTGADCYENFDGLAPGGGVTTLCQIAVSFTPDGGAVQGAASSLYAPPVLSNGNGALFGDPTDGNDATTYLTAGGISGASAILGFSTGQKYLGLLWGSVDDNPNANLNTITFYFGGSEVAQFTGADVSAAAGGGNCADGNQATAGTCYVNINLSSAFDKVVMTSSQHAFEFDNVAFAAGNIGVPEPGEIGLFLLGLGLIGSGYWFRKRRLA
jgi:hypothetical protein